MLDAKNGLKDAKQGEIDTCNGESPVCGGLADLTAALGIIDGDIVTLDADMVAAAALVGPAETAVTDWDAAEVVRMDQQRADQESAMNDKKDLYDTAK